MYLMACRSQSRCQISVVDNMDMRLPLHGVGGSGHDVSLAFNKIVEGRLSRTTIQDYYLRLLYEVTSHCGPIL